MMGRLARSKKLCTSAVLSSLTPLQNARHAHTGGDNSLDEGAPRSRAALSIAESVGVKNGIMEHDR
tara:strand:- start:95 stop:292 length:198 start_codon:yes stop_codon:yes gene_type:complete